MACLYKAYQWSTIHGLVDLSCMAQAISPLAWSISNKIYGQGPGLQALVAFYLKMDLSKDHQMTLWSASNLSEAQLACTSFVFLLQMCPMD
jgi:hypothetical protein